MVLSFVQKSVLETIKMRVKDLITILQNCNPEFDVKIVASYTTVTINEVLMNDGSDNVLVGYDIPPEMHGLDYKYEDR